MGKKKCKPDNNELLFRAKKKDYNKIRSLMNREGEEGASSVRVNIQLLKPLYL